MQCVGEGIFISQIFYSITLLCSAKVLCSTLCFSIVLYKQTFVFYHLSAVELTFLHYIILGRLLCSTTCLRQNRHSTIYCNSGRMLFYHRSTYCATTLLICQPLLFLRFFYLFTLFYLLWNFSHYYIRSSFFTV